MVAPADPSPSVSGSGLKSRVRILQESAKRIRIFGREGCNCGLHLASATIATCVVNRNVYATIPPLSLLRLRSINMHGHPFFSDVSSAGFFWPGTPSCRFT